MLQRQFSVAAASKAASAVSAWVVAATLLAGCGQKGPLMLPKPPAPVPAASPSASAAAPAASPPTAR
ncbi:MAG: lipoprotein [Pseudomonadota bacterium]